MFYFQIRRVFFPAYKSRSSWKFNKVVLEEERWEKSLQQRYARVSVMKITVKSSSNHLRISLILAFCTLGRVGSTIKFYRPINRERTRATQNPIESWNVRFLVYFSPGKMERWLQRCYTVWRSYDTFSFSCVLILNILNSKRSRIILLD